MVPARDAAQNAFLVTVVTPDRWVIVPKTKDGSTRSKSRHFETFETGFEHFLRLLFDVKSTRIPSEKVDG